MSQPPPYIPVHSFVTDSATDPSFPGQALDVEFQGVKRTTDAINANLALIQRDDGALANGAVGYDQLSPSLQTNGLAPADAWVTGTAYAISTAVIQNGVLYRCIVAHTSGVFATDLAAGKWLFVTSVPVPPPSPTTIGGVKSLAPVAHQWINSIGTDGTPTQTQPAFSDVFGTAAVTQGGTGQTTAPAGFDALAPTTTRGDLIYRNAVTNTRLPAGTAGFVLKTNGTSADPSWAQFADNPSVSIGLTANNGTATTAMRSDATPALSQSIVPTWTGLHTFNGGVVLTRPSATDGLTINNTLSGAAHYGFYETMTATGNLGSGVNYNLINVTADDAQCGSAAFGNAFTVQHSIGGSAMIGGRQAIQASVTMTAASSASNTNRNYVAGTFIGSAQSSDNGTNTGAGAAGGMFALNPVATLGSGVTNWHNISGGEVNIGMHATATSQYMLGWSVVGGYTGAGTAAAMGTGYNVSALSANVFDAGYIVSDLNGAWPIKAAGSLQRAYIIGSTPTVTNGTDWSAVSFTGSAFKSPNFSVSGNGSVTATLCNFTANAGATGFQIATFANTHNTAGDWAMMVQVGPSGTADTTSNFIQFRDGSGATAYGSINRNAVGVNYGTASDRRLKENFRASSVGLEDLLRIEVQDFNFVGAADHDVNGFVAQDLHEVYPWAVTTGGDDASEKPWQIDHGRLTPLLVKAVQELSAKVDDLTARLNALAEKPEDVAISPPL